jgi:thiol-disulfide isomerase/thioredoxin
MVYMDPSRDPSSPELPSEGRFPPLDGATDWLNSAPLTPSDLRGRVVLVDFWTYTCINWLRTFPYIRGWYEKYRDNELVVIGVHTPEFSFEGEIDNVRREVADFGVEHPVAVDSDYKIWTEFANRYWPARYLIDATGHIRHHHFGEGAYDRTERAIQRLLADAGADGADSTLVTPEAQGVEAAADWDNLQSAETYTGYARAQNFASPGRPVGNAPHDYTVPQRLPLNEWALSGEWTLQQEAAVLNQPNGRIVYRFHARDVNLVMAPGRPDAPVRFRVLIDGSPPGAAHGLDVDEDGNGTVAEPRVYQLIRQPAPITDRLFEIEFLDAGLRSFVFTFG